MQTSVNEKDRVQTQKRLLTALDEIIKENGFEGIGVNNVAKRAGVSKVLIYRYFESMDNMIIEYLAENRFWESFSIDFPKNDNLREFFKKIFHDQISELRANEVMRNLQKWELNTKNLVIEKLALKREAKGVTLTTIVGQLTQFPQEQVATMATILNASISYLILLSDTTPFYNGIDIQNENGWRQIVKGIDMLIDLWFDEMEKNKNA